MSKQNQSQIQEIQEIIKFSKHIEHQPIQKWSLDSVSFVEVYSMTCHKINLIVNYCPSVRTLITGYVSQDCLQRMTQMASLRTLDIGILQKSDRFLEILGNFKNLKALRICFDWCIDKKMAQVISNHLQLQKLHLNPDNDIDFTPQTMSILAKCKSLISFSLYLNNVRNEILQVIFQEMTQLEELELCGQMDKIIDFSSISQMTNLRSISFDGTTQFEVLFEFAKYLPQLQEADLRFKIYQNYKVDCERFKTLMKICPCITSLTASSSIDQAWENVIISNTTDLKSLTLFVSSILSKFFFEQLGNYHQNMKILSITPSCPPLHQSFVSLFATKLLSLQQLYLDLFQFTDKGLIYLKGLKKLKKLEIKISFLSQLIKVLLINFKSLRRFKGRYNLPLQETQQIKISNARIFKQISNAWIQH